MMLGPGCRVLQSRPTPAGPTAVGWVIRYNAEEEFVILRCVSLPSIGDRLTLYRGSDRVGEAKVTGPYRGSFVAADVVEGSPQPGDVARKLGMTVLERGERL